MKQKCQHLQLMKEKNKIMIKERAIEIVKNLTETIDKMEGKSNIISLAREDMFSTPTASKFKLVTKRKQIIEMFNLKQKEWK